MADTDSVDGQSPTADALTDSIKQQNRRTQKLTVGLIAVIAPTELALAVTMYPGEPVIQSLMFGIVPLLVFSYVLNARHLSGSLPASDRVFRVLTHRWMQVVYVALAVVGCAGVVMAGQQSLFAAALGGGLLVLAGLAVGRVLLLYR